METYNHKLTLEAAQRLANYEQVEIGLLTLKTWNRHRREILDELDLLRELTNCLRDYDLIAGGHIDRATWRREMATVLARAKAAGIEPIPF